MDDAIHTLLKRTQLHKESEEPSTLLLEFTFTGSKEEKVLYEAGDYH